MQDSITPVMSEQLFAGYLKKIAQKAREFVKIHTIKAISASCLNKLR